MSRPHAGFTQLPSGWTYRELGDVVHKDGISYGVVQPGSNDPQGIPIVRVKNLRNRRIATDDVLRISPDIEKGHKRTRLCGGEVLMSLVGSVGVTAIVPPELAGWNVARAVAVIRPKDISSKWLQLCLESETAQAQMRIWQNTTVQATLNLRDVRRLPVLILPERDRVAITDIIGALDEKIATTGRITRLSRALADAQFRAAASRTSTCLSISRLATAGRLEYGDGYRTNRKEYGKPGLPILRAADVDDGQITPSLADFIHENFRKSMGAKVSHIGDVVLTTKGTIGRVALVSSNEQGFVYSPQTCYFRVTPNWPTSATFLFYWFRSSEFWRQARLVMGNTDMAPYINLADIGRFKIALPEEPIMAELTESLDALEALARQNLNESRALAALRDALMPRLMSGELRVRDAEKLVEQTT